MKLSVIIPTLNEADQIGPCVASALAGGADEVLVVDAGSCDATVTVARQLGATVLVARRGRAAQQNAGARQATGDLLLFLHADCRLPADLRSQLAECPLGANRWGGFQQRVDAAGWRFRWLERGNAWRARRWGWVYGDQGLFMARPLFEQLGGFPQVGLMEDLLLSRMAARHEPPILLPGPLLVSARRWLRQGVVRQTLRNWTLIVAWRLGVSPDRLARFYAPHNRATASAAAVKDAGDRH